METFYRHDTEWVGSVRFLIGQKWTWHWNGAFEARLLTPCSSSSIESALNENDILVWILREWVRLDSLSLYQLSSVARLACPRSVLSLSDLCNFIDSLAVDSLCQYWLHFGSKSTKLVFVPTRIGWKYWKTVTGSMHGQWRMMRCRFENLPIYRTYTYVSQSFLLPNDDGWHESWC